MASCLSLLTPKGCEILSEVKSCQPESRNLEVSFCNARGMARQGWEERQLVGRSERKKSSAGGCEDSRIRGGLNAEWGKSWRLPALRSRRSAIPCSKMVVPGFGEKSPEAKAADSLHNFFTFLAVKIVLAQLQAYNPEAYQDLREFADQVSLKDGDKFLAELMRVSPRHKGLALRLIEVRSAYAKEDFEWENLRRVSLKQMEEENTRLMRDFLLETSKWSDKV